MTLVQIEYIIALDNYRHFALAAEKCFVTQPTLSMQIQKLEDTLGAKIFDRSKHPIEPTPLGIKILEQSRKILAESKKVSELIDDEKNEIKGDITLGVIPTLAPYLVPLFISKFADQHQNVKIQVSEEMTGRMIEMIKKDQIDIGVLVTPIEDDELIEFPLFYEEFSIYVSHRHPLYDQQTVEANSLDTDGLWILNEGHCFRQQTLNICDSKISNRYNNRVLYESGSLEALKKIVDKGGGYTLLPELFTLDMTKGDQTRLRNFIDPKPTREVSLIVKKSYPKQKLVKALSEEIISNLPPIMTSRKSNNVVKF
ncbi:MAG: hydrogen peroxide-inducible genes activator [Reichenbachiella sp.]